MNEAQIRRERTASVLKELIPEALSTLSDSDISSLCVTEVRCSKGRYDAEVFLDKMAFDLKEQNEILAKLKKVSSHLQSYCASSEGWYRAPKFHFKFDTLLEQQNHMENLFKKVKNELEGVKNDK